MRPLHNRVKAVVERALVFGGGAVIARRMRSQALLVLAYHNIVPTGSGPVGDRSLHLPQNVFAEQLDALLETHDIVSLREMMLKPPFPAPYRARPRVAITFDDAYEGALTCGVAELRARKLPATIFVTPAFLDGNTFWWDALSGANGLDESFRKRALTEAHGLTEAVVRLARENGLAVQEMPSYARGATTQDLRAALNHDQISLAAHTWNHPNLSSLSYSEIVSELARPLAWLKHFGDHALPMVSYPYGLADQRVTKAARDAGYSAAFLIAGGWATSAPRDRFTIPRLNVPVGVSRDGFVLRAAGLVQG